MRLFRCIGFAFVMALLLKAAPLRADEADSDSSISLKQRLINKLPPAIGDDLDIDTWGWLGGLQTNYENQRYYDAELGLGITKSFNQRIAIGAQGNFIDANGETRFELEKGYISGKLFDDTQTVLTLGKFNAHIGVEGRDFWNRWTGTPSLLFAAKPQDLLGLMVTQPIGDTRLTARPFLSEGFQGGYDFNQPPSAGLTLDYKPIRQLGFAMTNWVGPGMVMYRGRHMLQPFARAYGDDPESGAEAAVVENWEGPNFYAERGSTLYFFDASCTLRPSRDLTIVGEGLLGRTPTHRRNMGWGGFLMMANYDVTDQLHVFGRWSWLDDSRWLVTGTIQRCQELSIGAGYKLLEGLEIRGEYRHDFSSVTPDFDSVSLHVTFTY